MDKIKCCSCDKEHEESGNCYYCGGMYGDKCDAVCSKCDTSICEKCYNESQGIHVDLCNDCYMREYSDPSDPNYPDDSNDGIAHKLSIDNEEFNKARKKLGDKHTISFTCDLESEAIQDIIKHYKRPIEHDYNLIIAGTKYQDTIFMFNKEDISIDKNNNRVNINIRGARDIRSGLVVWEETNNIVGKDKLNE